MKHTWKLMTALLCLLSLLVTGCSGDLEQLLLNEMDAAEKEEEGAEQADPEADAVIGSEELRLFPLTGESALSNMGEHRPYAFIVNNMSVAMPLCGISHAEWVLEVPDQNSFTNLMFLITDPEEVSRVGAIDGARSYQVEIALGYDAILVHSSEGDEGTERMLDTYGLAVIDAANNAFNSGTFFLDQERQLHGKEYSLFADGSFCVSSADEHLGYRIIHNSAYDRTYGLTFGRWEGLASGKQAEDVVVTFAGGKTTKFIYDKTAETYSASQYGEPMTDGGEEPVSFSNVIAIYANTYPADDEGHMVMDLTEGTGYYFAGGAAVQIRWYKDGVYDVFHFESRDGEPIVLKQGITYVGIIQCGGYKGSIDFQ